MTMSKNGKQNTCLKWQIQWNKSEMFHAGDGAVVLLYMLWITGQIVTGNVRM